jgi:hypothetical protein
MSLDNACAFFKELVLRFHLPAELRVSQEGKISILVHKGNMIEQLEYEIRKIAVSRGFVDVSDIHWMKFDGQDDS